MADEDKQFEATPHKLKEVRKKGQVVKSKDVSTALSMMVMFSLIYHLAPFIWKSFSSLFVSIYEQIPNKSLDEIGFANIVLLTVLPMVLIIAPILLVAFFVSIIGDLVQIGPLIAIDPIMPKVDKLNPAKGFKNIFFTMRTYFELVKNIIKVLVLGLVGFLTFKAHFPVILGLCAVDNTFAIAFEYGKLIVEFVMKAGMFFILIAGGDYLFVKWKFLQDQKMSFKEIKDEYKNTEGDPHVKAALKERQMQMLQQAMLEAVPSSDFITTNPVHIAVALSYNQKEMRAPKVVAKGTELFAKKIVKIAKEHNIPIIENPPVARALFRLVEVNMEVPPELYKAVAEILMFVYNLRGKKNK